MTIKTRLTLQNTIVVATLFLVGMAAIYFISEHTRSEGFYHDLRAEAITKAHLFLKNQVDPATMHSIYLNNRQFIHEVEVAVYGSDFKMLYHDEIQSDIVKETPQMLRSILRNGEIDFYTGKYQAIGMVYHFGGKTYIVTAAAYDGYGHDNLLRLQRALGIMFVLGLTVIFAAGYLLARNSLRPIRDIVSEAESITAQHIDRRLPVRNERDELGELSTTFNALLDRLEVSFRSQKAFVSNVSHELRTPLAALMAELDLSLQKERTGEQYRAAIGNALQDAHRMSRLIEGLLNLAKADYQKEQIKMQEVRLDELLLDARGYILKAHPEYHIELIFEQQDSDDDRLITVMANVYLLTIAFSNLIENNCKYSEDHTSFIQISHIDDRAVVRLSDDGIGMSDKDLRHVFTLFYRGDKEQAFDGHGIGMALSQKIITLHSGHIAVHSEQGKGTTFIVDLPHI